MYRQHCLKPFPCRQVINNFVSVPVNCTDIDLKKRTIPCSAPPHLPFNKRSVGWFHIRTIPRKAPSHLPPLSKGGGLTARHKLLLCCVLLAIRPSFYIANFSAVKTEGLLSVAPNTAISTNTRLFPQT